MIQASYEATEHHITLRGHAGAGIAGTDIVCAAASILMWTLIAAVQEQPEYHAHVTINELEPEMEVRCSPTEACTDGCTALFEAFWLGFELLEDNYPDNVRTERSIPWQQ